MNKLIFFLFTFLSTSFVKAQTLGSGSPEMADAFRQEGKIYVVITVLVIIFAAIVALLFYLESRISKLEKRIKNTNDNQK